MCENSGEAVLSDSTINWIMQQFRNKHTKTWYVPDTLKLVSGTLLSMQMPFSKL